MTNILLNGQAVNGVGRQSPQDMQRAMAQQIGAMIRDIEKARQDSMVNVDGKARLCALMLQAAQLGWDLIIDPKVQTGRIVVTMQKHFWMDLKNGLNHSEERVLRMGTLFEPALALLMQQYGPGDQAKPVPQPDVKEGE